MGGGVWRGGTRARAALGKMHITDERYNVGAYVPTSTGMSSLLASNSKDTSV
jgi:hypothetical protein